MSTLFQRELRAAARPDRQAGSNRVRENPEVRRLTLAREIKQTTKWPELRTGTSRAEAAAFKSNTVRRLTSAATSLNTPRLRFRSSGLVAMLAGTQVDAATNAAEEIGIPELVPPYPQLPPTFWERHGTATLLLGLAILLVAGALYWLLRRNKAVVVLPPEVQARRELEALSAKVEDGDSLSRVSRILREYLRATFDLPQDELTTTEFCRVLSNHERVGVEFATKVSDFLRRCDERRFSAREIKRTTNRPELRTGISRAEAAITQSSLSVASAFELVAIGEARRLQLLQAGNGAQVTRPANT